MQFRADQYYQASLERNTQAQSLYKQGDCWALTMYCAGLAVECMLRAFRWKADTSFEGRHDLTELLRASRFLIIDDEHLRAKGRSDEQIQESAVRLKGAMNEVIVLWHNNLRFTSEASLLVFLKGNLRDRGVKGDPLKKNALDIIEAANTIITRGVVLWTSKTK